MSKIINGKLLSKYVELNFCLFIKKKFVRYTLCLRQIVDNLKTSISLIKFKSPNFQPGLAIIQVRKRAHQVHIY